MPIHPEDIGVRNFWAWFRASRVRDQAGRPLVVYHGTIHDVEGGFDLAKTGLRTGNTYAVGAVFFTSNPAAASAYAVTPYRERSPNEQPNVIPAYLSLQNPLEVDAEDRSWKHFKDRIIQAQHDGYDGMILRNVLDHASAVTAVQEGPVDVFAAFRPEQIKSAIGNDGRFDPKEASVVGLEGTERVKRAMGLVSASSLGQGVRCGLRPRRFRAG